MEAFYRDGIIRGDMRHHAISVFAAAVLAGAAVAADQQPPANPYGSTYQPLPARTTVIRNATIRRRPDDRARIDPAAERKGRGGGRERERAA
jgi:hypothetical protein